MLGGSVAAILATTSGLPGIFRGLNRKTRAMELYP